MDISVLLGFQKLSILISSQTRWVAVNPYMTCRLYDIDVYTYDHKCIQITILTSNFHLYTSFTHACPSDSHCNDSAKRWYNLPWLSVAPCTACNSENCPPQPRASWPSTFQIISAANWIFQNRESEHDVSRIILSQNGFRRRLFYILGFWDPCGNQGTRSGSIPWPSWTVWSFMGMLAFLEVKHASFEASPFPARWRNSFHNSSWIEGGTSWNLVASGTLKIFWRSFEDLQVLRFSDLLGAPGWPWRKFERRLVLPWCRSPAAGEAPGREHVAAKFSRRQKNAETHHAYHAFLLIPSVPDWFRIIFPRFKWWYLHGLGIPAIPPWKPCDRTLPSSSTLLSWAPTFGLVMWE